MGGEDPFGNSGMTLGNVGKVKLLLLPSLMHLKSYIYIYMTCSNGVLELLWRPGLPHGSSCP